MVIRTLTLEEARRRTKLDLLSDRQIRITDYLLGRQGTVASLQSEMSRKYPLHGEMIRFGMSYFASKGYEIYPRGIAVRDVYACPDFAFFKGDKIHFVECLTAAWTDRETLRKKTRLAKHGGLIFIVEHPECADLKNGERKQTLARLAMLSRLYPVYMYDAEKRTLAKFSFQFHRASIATRGNLFKKDTLRLIKNSIEISA